MHPIIFFYNAKHERDELPLHLYKQKENFVEKKEKGMSFGDKEKLSSTQTTSPS